MAVEFASTSLISDANLIGYWKLENANDSKSTHNLTAQGSPTFTSGLFNNAGTYNGTNQGHFYSTGATIDGGGNSDRAWSLWVKVTTAPSNASQDFLVWGDSVRTLILRYTDSSGTKTFGMTDGNLMDTRAAYTITTSTWYNFIVSYNASTKVYTLYINGVQAQTGTSNSPAAGLNILSIGFDQVTGSQWVNGQQDDVVMFNRQLTQADVNTINGITSNTTSFFQAWT